MRVSDQAGWQWVREFYERHHLASSIVLTIAVGSPFLGRLVTGIPGLIGGLFVSAASYGLSPYAVTKRREIRGG
jgi:hypothetical protein